MKFLILLAYYRRPTMVLNALQSINELEYNNFELVFIDDSGDDNFKETFYSYIKPDILRRSTYAAIMQSDQVKLDQYGSMHGYAMNEAIKQSDADIIIILCDDDALLPDYLTNLDKFYRENPTVNYAYSYVYFYDPSKQHYKEGTLTPTYNHAGSYYGLNQHNRAIDPFCQVDSSQVTFRSKCFKEDGIWYPYPRTRGLDAAIYKQFMEKYGPLQCWPTGFVGQYKGAFADQLGNRGYDFEIKNK